MRTGNLSMSRCVHCTYMYLCVCIVVKVHLGQLNALVFRFGAQSWVSQRLFQLNRYIEITVPTVQNKTFATVS